MWMWNAQAEAALAAAGITPASTLVDIDAGLRQLAATVTSQAAIEASTSTTQLPVEAAHASGDGGGGSRRNSWRGGTMAGGTGTLRRAAEDPDLHFFKKLDGYSADVPPAWAMLERGMKSYHRLLQERAGAMTQVCFPVTTCHKDFICSNTRIWRVMSL